MSLRAIVAWPDPVLSTACAPVDEVSAHTEQLAEDMLETMYAAPGRGLAAPQVGVALRVFVMDATWKEGIYRPLICVNPEIVGTSDRMIEQSEGCLSIPGISVPVSRPDEVHLRWIDLNGAACEQTFQGFAAACVQHEMDHLDGIVTLDRVDAETRARVLTTYGARAE
ncbi:MAG: peptide deformylase [Roseobacter sp.]